MTKAQAKKSDGRKKASEDTKKKRKSGTEDKKKSGPEDKKKSGQDDKKKSGQDDKKKSGQDDKKKSGQDDKKKSGQDDKKKSGQDDKKKSGQDDKKKSGNDGKRKIGTEDKKKSGPEDKKKSGKDDKKKSGGDKKPRTQSVDAKRTSKKSRPPDIKKPEPKLVDAKKPKSDRKRVSKSAARNARNLSEGAKAAKAKVAHEHKDKDKPVVRKTTPPKDKHTPLVVASLESKVGTVGGGTQLATAEPQPEDDNEYENLGDIQQQMRAEEQKEEKVAAAAPPKQVEAPPVAAPPAPAPEITRPTVEMDDLWRNMEEGDPFPTDALKALGKALLMDANGRQEQFVALWYRHGEPIMGRAWNNKGRLAACFTHGGKVYQSNLGCIQVLCQHPTGRSGFRYLWQPFSFACAPSGGWYPIKVGDSIPCVVKTPTGFERLGNVSLHEERATTAYDSKEEVYTGPPVRQFLVLFRKP